MAARSAVPGLGPLEAAIMTVLWNTSRPLRPQEVRDRIDHHPVGYTTVAAVLTILRRKGLASRARDGRAYVYEAAGAGRRRSGRGGDRGHVAVSRAASAVLDDVVNVGLGEADLPGDPAGRGALTRPSQAPLRSCRRKGRLPRAGRRCRAATRRARVPGKRIERREACRALTRRPARHRP